MQWFRFYSETLNDKKVQTLPLDVFKIWVNTLCYASSIDSKSGDIGTIDDVSFALRETKESVSLAFHALIERELIVTVGETFHIKSWSKRQFKSDTSTERVKKHRKRFRNVTVTPPDTDTDTDTKQKQIKKKITKEVCVYTDSFNGFWDVYPRKDGSKQKAFETFNQLTKEGIDYEYIIRGVKAYAASCAAAGTEQRYIAHATTWLNQRRWEADYSIQPTRITSQPKGKGDLAREHSARAVEELKRERSIF
jgi:hypothetical protein